MAKFPFIDTDNLGGPFNAFPLGQADWSQWNDLREELPNNSLGSYEFDVNLSIATNWAVFHSNAVPTHYRDAIWIYSFLTADSVDISFVSKTNSVR
jgi:hypothetical protein